MTEQQLTAFLEKLKGDSGLADRIRRAPDAKSYVAIANEAGLSLTAEDLEMSKANLSEAELEGYSGRATTYPSQSCRRTCPGSNC